MTYEIQYVQVSRNSRGFGFCSYISQPNIGTNCTSWGWKISSFDFETKCYSLGEFEGLLEWKCASPTLFWQVSSSVVAAYLKVVLKGSVLYVYLRWPSVCDSWSFELTIALNRYSNWLSYGLNARKPGHTNANPGSEWAISAGPEDFIYVWTPFLLF